MATITPGPAKSLNPLEIFDVDAAKFLHGKRTLLM